MSKINATERLPAIPERRRTKSRPPVGPGICPICRSNEMVEDAAVGNTGHFCGRCNRAF